MASCKRVIPNLEELRVMLQQECELRDSSLIQNVYDAVSVNFNRSEEVEDFVQSVIVARSKYPHLTIEQYRGLLLENRDALKDEAFFMKYNIMVPCPIATGDIVNPCIIDSLKLYNINLEYVKLRDLLLNDKKSVILASSST